MLNNMYNTYDNCEFSYYTPSTFDNRTRDYLLSRYTPEAVWDYSDTLNITFHIIDESSDSSIISEDLAGKYIKLKFYNFRDELIPFEYEIEAEEEFTVSIPYNVSKKYFKPGTYKCSVQLITYTSSDDEKEIIDFLTLMNKDQCMFYVQ